MLHTSLHGPAGAPVITCLHAVGISSWMWQRVAAHLPEFRVLLIDLPGHGESRDIPWVSLPDTADQVAAAIRAKVDQDDVHLAALSLGSYVGLHLVLRHPDLCSSAILSGIHPADMPNRRMMKLLSAVVAPLAPRPFFAGRTARMMGAAVDTEGFVAAAGQTRAQAFRQATNDVVDFDCATLPTETRTRLAFVAGSREHPLILAGLDDFRARFANSVTAIAPDLGHGWAGEDPVLFAKYLRAHMAGELAQVSQST